MSQTDKCWSVPYAHPSIPVEDLNITAVHYQNISIKYWLFFINSTVAIMIYISLFTWRKQDAILKMAAGCPNYHYHQILEHLYFLKYFCCFNNALLHLCWINIDFISYYEENCCCLTTIKINSFHMKVPVPNHIDIVFPSNFLHNGCKIKSKYVSCVLIIYQTKMYFLLPMEYFARTGCRYINLIFL